MIKDKVYVIGHRNPDTDAICSAVAYADLKQQLGEKKCIAARCGKIRRETRFVLDYFGINTPVFLSDVKTRALDMVDRNVHPVLVETDLRKVGRLMLFEGFKTIPVVNEKGILLGLVTVGDLTFRLLKEIEQSGDKPVYCRDLLSVPISEVMKKDDLVFFQDDELIEQVCQVMLETRYRNYPVLDEQGYFIGLVSRRSLLALARKKIILVDHNEKSQAVSGIEQAEVLEIIDHHRLADVQTGEPIYIRCEPVGSTATVIAGLYEEAGLTPEAGIAGILCAAVLSDTLGFRSPTTTPRDQMVMQNLAKIAKINVESFMEQMFQAGSQLHGRQSQELLFEDFKEMFLGNLKIGIGQIEVISNKKIKQFIPGLFKEMEKIEKERHFDLVLMMLTDILKSGTVLLVVGEKSKLVSKAFGRSLEDRTVFLPGVMSRKKQVVPVLAKLVSWS